MLLVSAVPRGESAVCIRVSPPFWASFPRLCPTPLDYHRTPSWAPCVTHQLPTSSLFYTWKCIYVNPNLPVHPTLPSQLCIHVCSLYLRLSSCPANRRICTTFLDSTDVLMYNIFFSDLLHSVWQSLGASTALEMSLYLLTLNLVICVSQHYFEYHTLRNTDITLWSYRHRHKLKCWKNSSIHVDDT